MCEVGALEKQHDEYWRGEYLDWRNASVELHNTESENEEVLSQVVYAYSYVG